MLAACSHKNTNNRAVNAANAAYSNPADASGLGEEEDFDEVNNPESNAQQAGRTYYFDFDSNIVHEKDKPTIYANAKYLAAHPGVKVMVEGHTDPRGSREYNIGLGERRAKAVATILVSKGVSPSQISIVSYGAEKLAVNGHSEQDYQLDRRVVLAYLK